MNNAEIKLIKAIEEFSDDPLGFAEFAFQWGKGDLAGCSLDKNQRKILKLIGDKCLATKEAIQLSVRSGKGIGKTAVVAIVILWFMSTRKNPQIVVTANSQSQLDTKTWRELALWHERAINKHWFKWTATKFVHIERPETWYAAAIPWSLNKAQAFAGTHAKPDHVLVIFDEASEIDDKIWEMADGAMTTEGSMWLAFGNPSKNTGRFYECFNKYRHRWINLEIDSRDSSLTNKAQIQTWLEDYGEDSDFFRVTVKGQAPRCGTMQFISSESVNAALGRQIHPSLYEHAPIIIGVDVARQGKDQTVICVRQGLAILSMKAYRISDTMLMASICCETVDKWDSDAIFIDSINMGVGVIDRMRQLKYDVIEVNSSVNAIDERKYFNLRAEMWGKTRDWLDAGGCIPDDPELRDDLMMITYGYDAQNRYQITKKDDLPWSPDKAESIIHTFAYPVNKKRIQLLKPVESRDYDPLCYI